MYRSVVAAECHNILQKRMTNRAATIE